nr:phospholipase D-like domain-containing protein [Atlantibacter hermannii]
MESVKNARQYIYIENQYFRFKDLVSKIHEALNNIRAKGFTNDLYLFVVTNSTTDPDIADGGVQTWKMLEALGRGDRMPGYTAAQYNKDPKNKDNPVKSEDIQPQQIAGLQTHICTLVSMDRKPGDPALRTYVHSKLMMIDDIFMIQGSANMNLRSMVFDSESAIMFQDTDHSNIIPPTRDKLWGLHTKKRKDCTGNDYQSVFKAWGKLLDKNSKIASSDSGDLLAPLIKFIDHNPSQKDKD